MSRERNELYEFGGFRLNPGEHRLERLDGVRLAAIPEKAFRALCILVENRGHLLTKRELIDQIWPDSFVEENNLDKCIHILRHTLGERPGEGKYIETVRKHGYRFVADVKQVVYTEPLTESGRYVFPKEVREISLTRQSGTAEVPPISAPADPKIEPSPANEMERQVTETKSENGSFGIAKKNLIVTAAVLLLIAAVVGMLLMLLLYGAI